tara:strand:+ start:326 stop:1855 length:1530 start_codon:yes stop_codon:yes gene_type:complete
MSNDETPLLEKPIRPDLYIALVAAAGTELEELKSQLKAQLSGYHYEQETIKVSALIADFLDIKAKNLEWDDRILKLMDGGDLIRKKMNSGDGVLSLVCAEIANIRNNSSVDSSIVGNTAFIIDSLKNPEEVKTLDSVYGRNFYTISIFQSENSRQKNLELKIRDSSEDLNSDNISTRAQRLVREDHHRSDRSLSQDVENTFPEADFFIDANEDVSQQVKRFVDIIFGHPFKTPTADENAMFAAKAESYRSCDLSRHVGAVIVGENGNVVARGCNEVPVPGGGIFVENGNNRIDDNRDYKLQYDPNLFTIQESIKEFIELLISEEIIIETDKNISSILARKIVSGDLKKKFADARLRNLIEFGRVVHAEMHAISEAARQGKQIRGTTLYCTTFPCHGCARHIISAGIDEVVYIEPYPKSLTSKLYQTEISVEDHDPKGEGRVIFRPFFGVAPKIYKRVFSYRPRKDKNGTLVQFVKSNAIPLGANYRVTNETLEKKYSASLADLEKKCRP